jgi:Family of unknown function (DUF6988)
VRGFDQSHELLYNRTFSSDTKTILLIAYLDIALEHHEAIYLLVKSQLHGSAFALVRSLFDAVFRALWINSCATEDQIEEVASRDKAKFPSMADMVAMIDQSYSTDNFFTSIKDVSWAAMCSYTHSGLLQITRRFSGDQVKPNYGDAEIREVLNSVNTAVILLSRMFFLSTGCRLEAAEVEKMMAEFANS